MRRACATALGLVLLVVGEARAHEHAPPHGGTLVELGEENAHLELVLDPALGQVTAYVLDGEAENAVRIAMPALELRLLAWRNGDAEPAADEVGKPIRLDGVANVLTGETAGNTSEFRGAADVLRGAVAFDAVLDRVQVRGAEWKSVSIRFPAGNEEPKE